ncbi:MAG: hypothetical protein IT367_09050 [Candidatus Hydrogenedentes bacterium]|nr:hypothetical protein [Candidatus Hydrogenedentota bacterium]
MSETVQNYSDKHKFALLLLGVFLGLLVPRIACRDSKPDFLQDGPLIVENYSNRILNDLAMISDRGYVQVGTVLPGQTIIDQRAVSLGEIDYHLIYVVNGVPQITGHLYNGGRQTEFRLYHRYEHAEDGATKWIAGNRNKVNSGETSLEAKFDASVLLPCCTPKFPPSFLQKQSN